MTPASPTASRTLAALVATSLVAGILILPARSMEAQSLIGSRESMLRQNEAAQRHEYLFLRTRGELLQAVQSGTLVEVRPSEDLRLVSNEVSYPYARYEVKNFLGQLARAYRAECGEPLVVTSLCRPIDEQPWNASPISVHPAGMAADLRRSDRRHCRQWLEGTLLALEGEGIIEATREHYPPHYHIAVFPDPLLLPGPIGDPNGIARLVALRGPGVDREAGMRAAVQRASLHVTRGRHGRLQITQGATAVYAARKVRHGRQIVVTRSSRRHRHGAAAVAPAQRAAHRPGRGAKTHSTHGVRAR